MKRSLFLLSFVLFSIVLKADHMMGSDIEYTCISPGKYKVLTKIYRQCAGIPLNFSSITVYCGTTSYSVSVKRISIRDITPTCASGTAPCNPSNTMSNQGVEEHTFECTIDFSVAPYNTFKANNCCEVYFAATQCCRDAFITTQPYDNFYTESMIDICNVKGKCNNSPQLTTPPISYICCNQPFTFNNGVNDKIDGDSLSYTLGEALSAKGVNISKTGAFTSQIPMTPFCLPPGVIDCKALPNAKPPRGFYFDKSTGDIIFTPTDCSEAGPVVIVIDEYRKDSSGTWLRVGTTRRDMMMIVVKCPDNNPPQITNTVNKYAVCEGSKICFTIKTVDNLAPNQKIADTTYLSWNYGIPGATFKIVDPTAREKSAEFCWQTSIGDARPNSYNFTTLVKDDNCPRPATTAKGFLIVVKYRAEAKRKYTLMDCGKLKFNSSPKDTINYKGKYDYTWTIRDSTNSGFAIYKSFKKLDSFKFKKGGRYIITHEINNLPINCPTTYEDTVIIPPVLDVELTFGKDTFVCAGDSLVIKPIVEYGYTPFKYRWESPLGTFKAKDTQNYFVLKPTANTTVMLKLTDNFKCVDIDTIKVKYQPLPVVDIGPDKRICTYMDFTLDAQNEDTMRYYWQPDGDSTRFKTVFIAGKYSVKVIDKLGCNKSDTMELFVNDTVVAIAKPDREICINDTLKVKANRRPQGYTRTMSWTDLNTGIKMSSDSAFKTKITQIVPRSYDLFLQVNQGNVICEDHDTLLLTVNPLPTFIFSGIPPHCFTDGAINLTQKKVAQAKDQLGNIYPNIRYFQKYKKPSWIIGDPSGPYVYDYPNFINNNQVPASGLKDTICYEYKDFKGCYNSECRPIRLNANPDVKVIDGIFCQKAGLIPLDKLAVIPFSKVGGVQTWRCLEVPPTSGVDPAAILKENTLTYPSTYWLDPGLEGENHKTGDYKVEYCFKNPTTSCQRCDTTTVTVVKLPEIQFDPIPSQCINYPLLALDSFVTEKNSGKRFPSGTWSCIAYGGSRDMTSTAVKNAINNSVKSQKFFNPGSDQNGGLYLLKFTDVASGCPVTDSTEVSVNGLPQINLDNPDTICSSGGLFQLTSNYPINDVNGKWSEPTLQTPQFVTGSNFDPSQSLKVKKYEGPYKVYYAYTNPLTRCSSVDSLYKTVQSQPEATVTTAKPYQQCERGVFNMTGIVKHAKSATWSSSGDGTFSAANNKDSTKYREGIQDTANSGAIITLTTDKEGVCPQATDNVTLIIEPYPQFTLPPHFVQCEGPDSKIDFSSVVIKPNGSPNLRYTWDYGNGSSLSNSTDGGPQGVPYPVSKEGWYDVVIIVHNQWGANAADVCSTRADSLDYVRILPQPVAGFSSNPAYFTTVAFPKFKFYNETKIGWGIMSHKWNFNDGRDPDDVSSELNPIHTYPADTTSYRVHLYSEFRYEDSINYCFDTITKVVVVGPDVTVFVPTAFSPEGTGPRTNNVFNAVVNGEKSFHIEVFNRWGEKLWETDNKYETWNGTFKAEDCQQDVYAWVVKVTDYKGEEYRYEGTVSLLR